MITNTLQRATDQIDDLRRHIRLQLEQAAEDQAEIRRAMDDLIVAAPSNVPLSEWARTIIQAGVEAGLAFQELERVAGQFLTLADCSSTRTGMLRGNQDCVARSGELMASANTQILASRQMVAESRKLIAAARGREIQIPLLPRLR